MIDLDMKEKEIRTEFDKKKEEVALYKKMVTEGEDEMLRIQGKFRLLEELRKECPREQKQEKEV